MNDNELDDRAIEALCGGLLAAARAGQATCSEAGEELTLALCNYVQNCCATNAPIYRYTLRRVDDTMKQLAALSRP